MSDTGVDAEGNPITKMPSTVQVKTPLQTPSATVAAPPSLLVPSITPSAQATGPGGMDMSTDAINNLVAAKSAEMSAGIDAMKANTAVDVSAAKAISGVQDSTLQAYQNIQKAQSLPDGIAKIFGLFDSDYNKNFNLTTIQANQVKAASVTAAAAAIKEQNNELPSLLGKISSINQDVLNAQNERNKLLLSGQQFTLDQQRVRQQAIETRIHMSEEARKATEFKLRGIDTAAMPAMIAQAQAGKGPFKGQVGLLQDAFMSKQMVEANLSKAQAEASKGNREEHKAALVSAIANFPVDYIQGQIQKSGNSGLIEIPTGQVDPKTKQPVMQQVPTTYAQEAMVQAADIEQKANEHVAADMTERLNVIPTATNIMNGAQALAATDPRATSIFMRTSAVLKNMNGKDPQSVTQTGVTLTALHKEFQGVVKENAEQFQTPTAKAAYIKFGDTGKFDTQGGTAVAAESVGIPSLIGHSLYKDAWGVYANHVASTVNEEHSFGGLTSGNPNGNLSGADAMQAISQMMQRNQGREKLTSIGTNILADPVKSKQIGRVMTGAIQGKVFNDTLAGLAQQKGAAPIWNDLYQHSEQLLNDKNQFDWGKLATQLERATVMSGGKINYSKAFLSAMRNYGVNAENASGSDPSYTDKDRALEAAIFGHNPYRAITSDLLTQSQRASLKAHEEMKKKIEEDVNGTTQRKAVEAVSPYYAFNHYPAHIPIDMGERMKFFKNVHGATGVDLTKVPSATGTGQTTDQIAQLYANGY